MSKPKLKHFVSNNKQVFKTTEGYVFLNFEEIIRIEADYKHSLLYSTTRDKPIRLINGISDVENMIHKELFFFRCHRSHIVNVSHIWQFKEKVKILSTSKGEIPISTKKVKEFKELMCE